MALPPQHRLRGHRVFDRIYRQGLRLHGDLLVLRLLAAEPALLAEPLRRHPPSSWRCGVVVSAKVHKRAVRRNRLRRLIHAPLMLHPPSTISPQWLLLSLKPGSADAEEALVLGECSELIRKAGLSE